MQDMSEREHQALRTRLSFLQSCITQANLQPVYRNGREVTVADLEEKYENCLEKSCILISRPNQFPGYRSVVLFNSFFNNNRIFQDSNLVTLATVSSDGRLNSHLYYCEYGVIKSPSSIGDAIKLFETRPDEWKEMDNRDTRLILFGAGSGIDSWFPTIEKNLESIMSLLISVPRTEVIKSVRKQVQHDFKQARLALCNALDRDVLKIMRGTGLASIRAGGWLTGGDGVSREIILARKQAVRAYPILAQQFVTIHSGALRKAIDARTSLSDAIAFYFNLDKTGQKYKVKRLQGLTRQRTGFYFDHNITYCRDISDRERIRGIINLPDGIVPETRDQFRKLKVIEEFGYRVFVKTLCQTMARLSREGSSWKFIDRIEETSGRNVVDAVDFLARKLYIPVLLNKIGMIADHRGITPPRRLTEDHGDNLYEIMLAEVKKTILQGFKIRELLDWSDRYHRNIARYEDRLVAIRLEQDWVGISGTIEFGDDYIARELTSSKALKMQGRAEDHCVGGYLPLIVMGVNNPLNEAVLIFSIEKNNEILSTAEIGCIRKPCRSIDCKTGIKTEIFQTRARVVDNLARSNKGPSRDAKRIATRIVKHLEQVGPDAWQAYLDGLEQSRAEQDRISGIDAQIRNCGFDPFDRVMMERVWRELRQGLPRKFRNTGLDGFIDHVQLDREILIKILGVDPLNFYVRREIDDDGREIAQESVDSPGPGFS